MRPQMIVRWMAGAVLVACGLLAAQAPGRAQSEPAVLLVLDGSAIDYGDETHLVPAEAANVEIAKVGLREALPYFAARIGESMTIPGGHESSAGWFALRTVTTSWASEEGANDGLENFALAGAGLGSPDDTGNRTALLNDVSGIAPLDATGLGLLTGRKICGVVYLEKIAIAENGTASLAGANLGLVAFRVTGVEPATSAFGAANVEILDVHETCNGALVAMADAPEAN
jgi:hypothetical protein